MNFETGIDIIEGRFNMAVEVMEGFNSTLNFNLNQVDNTCFKYEILMCH